MKKFFFLLITIISFNVDNVFAQYSTHSFLTVDSSKTKNLEIFNQKNILGISPLALIVGGLEMGYERVIDKNKSIKVILGYYSATTPWSYSTYNVSNMEGFKAEMQYRAHLEKENFGGPMGGFYVGGFLQYRQIILDDYNSNPNALSGPITANLSENVNASALYPGVLFGYQLFVENIVFVDFNLGGGVIKPLTNIEQNKKADISVVNPYINGVVPRFNLSIGFPF